ncbi:hypothetical protein E2C01_087203 [Portunus trituberculatus]|uniref:Uncharacterized protein n=1 Tax=Portunus trituberculatus TaxID=210409 RepID=A0A5B7J2Q5_PORTR|nr:hypothetical protein [Portunus trituberculatus]
MSFTPPNNDIIITSRHAKFSLRFTREIFVILFSADVIPTRPPGDKARSQFRRSPDTSSANDRLGTGVANEYKYYERKARYSVQE